MRYSLIFAVLAAAALCRGAESPTFAERLGWPKGSRVLILHSDDAGMSHESNQGTIEAMTGGVVNSTSVMMPCPWVPEFARMLKAHPELDVGLHLTLTAEWKRYRWGPLAGKSQVPGLVDAEGCLWHRVQDVIAKATPAEVEKEIRAQIARAEGMGIRPTHLDSHMGTLFENFAFFAVYVKVALEKKIPPFVPATDLLELTKDNPTLQALGKNTIAGIWDAGLPVIDHYVMGTGQWRGADKEARYRAFAAGLKPGITMAIVHCTKVSPTFAAISGSGPARAEDLRTAKDPRFKQVLEAEGIKLTTWRALTARRKRIDADKHK